MLTKNDFAAAEWSALRETPHLVGAAMMMSGSSGLGTVKETFAMAKSVLEGASSSIPLVRDLSNRSEVQETQESLRGTLGSIEPSEASPKLRTMALDHVKSAVQLVSNKGGSAEEVQSFREWIYRIAEDVAKAAKEGGFMGIGGTQVSEGERAFLTELRTALKT